MDCGNGVGSGEGFYGDVNCGSLTAQELSTYARDRTWRATAPPLHAGFDGHARAPSQNIASVRAGNVCDMFFTRKEAPICKSVMGKGRVTAYVANNALNMGFVITRGPFDTLLVRLDVK